MTSSSVALAWIELSISSASASAVLLYPLARIAVTARCAGMIFLRALAVGGLSIIPTILPIFERLGHISEAREILIVSLHSLRFGFTLCFSPPLLPATLLPFHYSLSLLSPFSLFPFSLSFYSFFF